MTNDTDETGVCQATREKVISTLLIAGLIPRGGDRPIEETNEFMWEDPTDKLYWFTVDIGDTGNFPVFKVIDSTLHRQFKWKVMRCKLATNITLAKSMARKLQEKKQ